MYLLSQNNQKNINFSLEIFPTENKYKLDSLCETVNEYEKYLPTFISITEKPGNSSNIKVIDKITSISNIPLAAHLIGWDKKKDDIKTIANKYWDLGIKRILALRGDPINGIPSPYHFQHASDLIEELLKIRDFDIYVAAYPEKHPEAKSLDKDIDNLKRKQDLGAKVAITQFFFDPEVFLNFRDLVVKKGITMDIVPGIKPILNFDHTCRMAEKCEANVPHFLHKMFENESKEDLNQKLLAMNVLTHQVTRLILEDVTTFHFFTLNELVMTRQLCQWMKVAF